ncbi:MAG: hypothetical protein IJ093_03605 [Bacilli bacterium]|nr:hypothetical protein [Bacilli bacterium]
MKKLFVLAGKARSGKDTVAEFLEKSYSDKKIIKLMYGYWVKNYALMISLWDGSEENKPRELLQQIAAESRSVNPNYVIRRMEEDINILKNYADVIIITDARMPEEVSMPKEKFLETITVKVSRDNFTSPLSKKQQKDFTETALDKYNDYDYVIENDGTLDKLEDKIKHLVESEWA